MSRRRRRPGYTGKGVKTWMVAVAAIVIIGGMAGSGAYLHFGKRTTDRATGCPTDHYDSVTIALIDLTDPISPTQAAALKNALMKVRNDVPKFGRLEIYPLRSTATSTIEPLFAGCSPGSGRDVDSRLYGNPELADRQWRQRFGDRVDAVITDIQKQPPQDNSPIFEGIQSVAVTAFGLPITDKAKHRQLILFSDMIHHTAELSMYQGAPAFERFKAAQYYLRVKPFLRGANVDVYLIVRETRRSVQQPSLYKFWVDFIGASEGFLRNWEPLQ